MPIVPFEQSVETGRVEPVFKKRKVVNPFPPDTLSRWGAMKAHLKPDKAIKRPPKPLPADSVDISNALPDNQTGLYVTLLGHSSILMQIDGVRLLIDPVIISNNVSPVPFFNMKRFQKNAPVCVDDLPFIDAVFISHDHYDHLDKKTVLELASKTGFFFTPLRVGKHLRKWGIDDAKIREYTWWQEDSIKGLSGETLHFACTPARHFSGRGMFSFNNTLWASWVFIGNTHRAFYSGDTSYAYHFRQIGYHYGPFDLTMIENGQYNVNWSDSHLMPEEAVKAHLDLGGRYMKPVHWGSFRLALHDWWEPPERASKEASNNNVPILTPRVGQTVQINDYTTTSAWWKDFLPEN